MNSPVHRLFDARLEDLGPRTSDAGPRTSDAGPRTLRDSWRLTRETPSASPCSAPPPKPQSAVGWWVVGVFGRDKCPLSWENRVCKQPIRLTQEGTVVVKPVSQSLGGFRVVFDDDRAVASAGLVLPVTLGRRLGLDAALDASVSGRDRRGDPNGSAKAMTLISSLLAGGEFISDVGMLHAGATRRVLGGDLMSSSRCGEWLRCLSNTDVSGLSLANNALLEAGWSRHLGPEITDPAVLIIDVDGTHIDTFGVAKEGTRKRSYEGRYGYTPLVCAEASTGQVIAGQLRTSNAAPARDAGSFLADTFTQLRAITGPAKPVVLRADSGFYTKDVVDTCRRHNIRFSITMRLFPPIRRRIETIDNTEWALTETAPNRQVHIAEIAYAMKGRSDSTPPVQCRLIVKRTTTSKDTGAAQTRLFDLVDYHAFITDQPGDAAGLAERHRQHAVIEATIRDLKHGMALNHMPSGSYLANAGWLQLNIIAYNLALLTTRTITNQTLRLKTIRHRYLTIPGRITTTARTTTLHLPTNWPWEHHYKTALNTLAA